MYSWFLNELIGAWSTVELECSDIFTGLGSCISVKTPELNSEIFTVFSLFLPFYRFLIPFTEQKEKNCIPESQVITQILDAISSTLNLGRLRCL